jgi:NADPH2:quinone reductase
MLVSFGNASGPAPAVDPGMLAAKGSLYFTRPTLASYAGTRDELEHLAGQVFDLVTRGILQIRIEQRYPLAETVQAHRDLEAGRTRGASILEP